MQLASSSSLTHSQQADASSDNVRILIVGDLHFSSRSLPILEVLQVRLLEQITTLKPDHVVFLGDTHDRFGQVNTTRDKEVVYFLHKISLLVPFTLLIGNHDIPNKTLFYSEDHAFNALKFYWKNTTIVDKCIRFTVKGLTFGAVAYCPNGRLHEGLKPVEPLEELAAVFCHQEIRGCLINGIVSAGGDKWSRSMPTIFCGHIHDHHTPQANVHYVGSPYQDNFGEKEDKSISLVTFSNEGKWKEKRIYLDLPKKIRLHMTAAEFWDWKPVSPNLYNLTVTCTSTRECQTVRESPEFKKMTVEGNRAEVINTSQISEDNEEDVGVDHQIKIERRSLKQIVAESIARKPHLQEIHNLVFGTQ
ncbi:Hypothetical protein POVR2_LOCUS225 [uncultured virus]|nr:Hypothetical protein POVR2_LOCUS225 [uncultured virus]